MRTDSDSSTDHLRSGFRPLLLLLLLAFLPTALAAQDAAGTGQVVGRALQAETGEGLAGAEVRVVGTSIATLTGPNGRFLMTRVPAGNRTIVVTYIGREDRTLEATVRAGDVTEVEASLPVAPVALEGLEVLGFRAMSQARALSEQKNAPNILNVVAADQMGRFPDASAPEALQRVPGIAVERDQGEGRYIQIRGGRTEFTQVNINGASVPSPEGDDRQVAMDAIPVDILESIEVTKAITPDMDASAIGGAVNLVTRTAPETRTYSLEAGGGYAPIREEPSWEGSLSFGDRFAEGRLGVLLSGSYSTRSFGSDDIEPEYDLGDPGLADDELVEFQSRYYTLERNRLGVTASLDYRFSPTSEIRLSGTYNEHQDTEERQVLNHVIEDGELAWEHKNREETLEIASARLGGSHVVGAGIELDWGGSWSQSAEDTPFDREIFFLQEGVAFSPDMTDPDRPRPNPSTGAVGNPFFFDGLDSGNSLTENRDLIGHVDVTIPYELGSDATGRLKLGVQIRDKNKDQEVFEETFELADGGGPFVLGQDVGRPFNPQGYNPGRYAFPPNSTTGDEVLDFADRFGGSLESETDIESDTEDYVLDERVTAAYVMTELNFTDRFMLLPGVRFERTSFDSDGFDFDPDTEELTPVSAENEYDNFFPMVHLRYRLGTRTNLRAAYTSTINRPNFINLVPFRLRDDEDLELGNPDLDPTTSQNFDLLLEHYDDRIGVVSAGVFYKDLTDPIFIFVTENQLGGDTEQPGNGESGEILGAEVAVQQQLSFFPVPFDGLGIYANYTFTDSEGTLPDGRTAKLLGQADHIFNAALSYERGGFSGQLSLNYRDEYIDEYGDEAAEDIFVGSRHQLDFSANYRVTPTGALYVELLNLTNEPFTLHEGVEDRPRQIEFYEPWGVLGFRLTR